MTTHAAAEIKRSPAKVQLINNYSEVHVSWFLIKGEGKNIANFVVMVK